MAISILNTGQGVSNGGAFTAAAGNNRLMVITTVGEASAGGTPAPTEITFGSATLSGGKIVEAIKATTSEASGKCTAGIWYILEKDIPSGSNTISATWSVALSSGTVPNFNCFTLGSAKQESGLVENTASDVHNIGSELDPWSSTIVVAKDTVQILSACVHVSVASTPAAGWTEDQDGSQSVWRIVSHYLTSSSAGTVTYGLDFAAPQAGVAVVASFASATITAGRMMMMGVG